MANNPSFFQFSKVRIQGREGEGKAGFVIKDIVCRSTINCIMYCLMYCTA